MKFLSYFLEKLGIFIMKFKRLLASVMAVIMVVTISSSSIVTAVTEKNNYSDLVNKLEKTTYLNGELGAVYSKDSTEFKVWAPSASKVALNLYATGSDSEKNAKDISTTDMQKDESTGVWSVNVKGDLNGTYYTYSVTTNGDTQETGDIYAKACGVNSERSMVIDLNTTNPENWDKDNRILFDSQTEAVIWEVHIKDFSNSETSGVSKENRGKYKAFTEQDTTLNSEGDLPTCINYLKQMGVNTVHINPFYDYQTIDETVTDDKEAFNWGYDPVNYNVPEGSYSSNPYDGEVRINETKQMVQALHNAGIAVVMDVVYNHTYTFEDSFFNRTVPNYYYRFDNNGVVSGASGCGNDTASEHVMYRKYMIDSVYYWATEYHLDGFRFDLMGLHDVDTMNAIRDKLDSIENGNKILMYGEAWDMAVNTDAKMASQSNVKDLSNRIGAFNDKIRDAIKGDNFTQADAGFIQGCGAPSMVKTGVKAQTDDWAKQPSQTVTYASAHDNYTMYDKLVASVIKEDADYTKRYENLVAMNKLSAGIILTSQGIPFMLAGEEMARTKLGDHNSYKSKASINEINWNNLTQYPDLIAYYSGLMQIRKNFAPFTCATKDAIENMYFYEKEDQRALSFTMNNTLTNGKQWDAVTCIYNSNNDKDIVVKLEGDAQDKEWVIIANDKSAGLKSLGEVLDGKVEVKKSSLVVLAEKSSFKKLAIAQDSAFIDKMSQVKITDNTEKPTEEESKEETTKKDSNQDKGFKIPYAFVFLCVAIVFLAVVNVCLINKKKKESK